jgi:hypothetical protein
MECVNVCQFDEGRDDKAAAREAIVYQIQVRGVIDVRWSDWFGGLKITPLPNGDTLLTGPVRDQAALHGLLARIRDLGLPLLSLNRLRDPE